MVYFKIRVTFPSIERKNGKWNQILCVWVFSRRASVKHQNVLKINGKLYVAAWKTSMQYRLNNRMQYNAISLHWQSTVPVCKAVIFTDKVALINCLQESREIFSCGRCPDVQTSSYTIVRSNTSLTKTKGTSKSTHLCARNRWDPSKPQILLCFQKWKRGSLHWLNRSHRVHPMQLLEICTDYNLFQTRWELKYLYKFPKAFSQIFHVPVFLLQKVGELAFKCTLIVILQLLP